MYLSRLMLNPRARRVQRELANPYELHRTLMRAFPRALPAEERILFRVDIDEHSGIPVVLLQSHTCPDWAWLGDPGAQSYLLRAPETKSFNFAFQPGQILSFRLRANPTKRCKDTGQRVGFFREQDQRTWLERKGEQGGFRVVRVAIAKEGNVQSWQPLERVPGVEQGPKARQLVFLAVRFDGLLQVTDPAKLWATVQMGIGSGKGLGFGLLSLAPVPGR